MTILHHPHLGGTPTELDPVGDRGQLKGEIVRLRRVVALQEDKIRALQRIIAGNGQRKKRSLWRRVLSLR